MARIAMGSETDECDLTLLYSICKSKSRVFAKIILFHFAHLVAHLDFFVFGGCFNFQKV